jgi:hypothetical protein
MNRFALAAVAATATLGGGAYAADLMPEMKLQGVVQADAPAAMTGDGTFYVGGLSLTDYYDDAYSFTGGIVGASGRVNIWFGPEMSGQLDVSGEHLTSGYDSDYDYSVYNAAAHLSWRPDTRLLGVFGSVGSTDNDNMGGTFATVGVEGQVDLGQVQLYGQAGLTRSLDTEDPDYDVSAPFIRGEARYFVDPNLMLSANAGYTQITYDGPDKLDGYSWGAAAEYKFDDSPMSVFASYQGSYEDEPDEPGESWAKHAVLVGVKISDGTLEEAAKSGATLRDYNPITGYEHLRFTNWE